MKKKKRAKLEQSVVLPETREIEEQQHLRDVPSLLLRTVWLGLVSWWGGMPRATQCYGSDRSLQLSALDKPPMTEAREHAQVVCRCQMCCRVFCNRVSFQSGISWLSHTSPTCPLLRCSPTPSFFSRIYFLWQLPTSDKSVPPLTPREYCADPCLASTLPLPKSHPPCLFCSAQSAAVPPSAPAEFPSRGSCVSFETRK